MSTLATQPPANGPAAAPLAAPLAQLRRRTRLYLALDGAIGLVAALIIAGLAQLALDRWLRFSLDQRAMLNALITLLWLAVIYRAVIKRLLSPLSDRVLAGWVDRAHPQLHDRFRTAVELAEVHAVPAGRSSADSRVLIERVLRDADQAVQRVRVLDVLDHARAGRQTLLLLLLLGLIGAAWSVMPRTMNTWFLRNWLMQDIPWQQSTHILPIGFDERRTRRIPRGDELEVRANVEGEIPDDATLIWSTASGRRGEEVMTIEGGRRLMVALGALTEDLSFRITGGDERTEEFLIEAAEPPHVVRTVATLTPPAYTDSPPVIIEQQTVFELLAGSTLEIAADLNKVVTSAEFVGASGSPISCVLTERSAQQLPDGGVQPAHSVAQIRWPNPPSGTFRLELVDRDGWRDRSPVRFTFKIVPDRPPSSKLEAVGFGELITPEAELSLRVAFEDPYGLATAALLVKPGDVAEQERPFPDFRVGLRRYETETRLPVAALGCVVGDRLRITAAATDLVPEVANIGRSTPLELRVVSREDLLADLARRELELRREFEQLLAEQRTLQDSYTRLRADLLAAATPPAALQRLAGLARQQSTHATRCLAIANRFDQLLAEMQTNRVARAQEERRIGAQIITPLLELARETMPLAATAFNNLRERRDPEGVTIAERAQEDVVRKMRAVLANMLEWEGFREAVDLLRDLIGEQSEIRAETLRELEQQLQDILDLEVPPPATQPGATP